MTKDDIMRMAREAGLHSAVLLRIYDDREAALCDSEIAELRKIERFSTLVAAAEREACAKVCDTVWNGDADTYESTEACNDCAAAIRERTTP